MPDDLDRKEFTCTESYVERATPEFKKWLAEFLESNPQVAEHYFNILALQKKMSLMASSIAKDNAHQEKEIPTKEECLDNTPKKK
jgi:hypothetical protein